MARRVVNRKKLKTKATVVKDKKDAAALVKNRKSKKEKAVAPAAQVKVRKLRAKKVKIPPRMRVRWCIYDGGMKPVALFDYNQLPAAKAKLAEFLEKKPTYFLQLFKELLPAEEADATAG